MIAGSAVRTKDGRVWSLLRPARHGDVFDWIEREIGATWLDYIADRDEGFITETGQFLDRREGLKHVLVVGQTLLPDEEGNLPTVGLASEDVWSDHERNGLDFRPAR